MPASTPTALHRPEMPVATENKEMNAEATTPAAKDGAKTEANRKKKERQKAKARAEKAAAQETIAGVLPSAEAVAAGAANASTTRSERRHAGENMPGEDRGLGMFATEAVSAADVIASATPALSVVFDECVDEVCGFCFKCEEPSQTEEAVVLQRSATGFGLILDDRRSWTGGAALGPFPLPLPLPLALALPLPLVALVGPPPPLPSLRSSGWGGWNARGSYEAAAAAAGAVVVEEVAE